MIRAGGYQGPQSVHTRGMRALGAALPGFSLLENVTADGSAATDLLRRVESGELDLCYFASSYLAARAPALLAFDIPFAFADRASAYRAVDGELGRLVAAEVAARTGFAVLAFWDNGFRHLSNRARPLARPEDCRGLSIRTLDNQLHQDVFRSFGFRPIMIDVRDLPEAVRDGTVDAQENPLTNTVNFGLHRTHRFHSLTGHLFGVAPLLANRTWYEGLGARRGRAGQGGPGCDRVQRRYAQEEEARCLAILAEDGAEVLAAGQVELAAFRAAASPVSEAALADSTGDFGFVGMKL